MIWTSDACDGVAVDAPDYAVVSCGNPNNGNCLDNYCAPASELHEARCCSDVQLPGYQQKNGCAVWAESIILSASPFGNTTDACVHEADAATAFATCNADGARVCTVAELEGACTAGTGCGHDGDLIWSSEACTNPPGKRARCGDNILAGCAANSCADPSEGHEVRCCSDTELPGYQQKNGCAVFAESQFLSVGEGDDGCVHEADFATAALTCDTDGARLCTSLEVTARCTSGTGCDNDSDLIWTSQDCQQSV
jgi:hypothetical protein